MLLRCFGWRKPPRLSMYSQDVLLDLSTKDRAWKTASSRTYESALIAAELLLYQVWQQHPSAVLFLPAASSV